MKSYNFDNTNKLFEAIKEMNLWQRLFNWKRIISLSLEAYNEFKTADKGLDEINDSIAQINDLNKDLEHRKEKIMELQNSIKLLESKKDSVSSENIELEKQLIAYKKLEEKKQEEYDSKVERLNTLRDQMEEDRLRIKEEREAEIAERFERMKQTWRLHESNVEQYVKGICKRHSVEYLDKDKLPFEGKPDNTIQIANQYIIFDAKSPQGEDLTNFPKYVQSETEKLKKYAKIPDVKKDLFLIVPTNTIEHIKQLFYNMSEYYVHVITIDSVEPVILTLKKIEEYEFAEQLSPEDRDNICRIIGRFAHATKRRIQVDQYFTDEFIDILTKTSHLPEEILEQAVKFESSGKLNPPMERRSKKIELKKLEKDKNRQKRDAEAKNIIITTAFKDKIEDIPLNKVKKEE